jgi:prolipoprotein diacylglyceryl transferase
MTMNYIVWDVNPRIVELFGTLEIRWYGLLWAASFIFGYIIFMRIFKKEGLTIEMLDKLTMYMIVGTIAGARLGHCLFYEPGYYLSNPQEILFIWQGGLASHGAAFGILLSLYLFIKKVNKSYIWILDRIVIVVALAGFFIRMGNLMNSEIYGIQTNMPWGFIFARNNETVPKHPTQIYEALAYLAVFLLLFHIYFRTNGKFKRGLLFGLFLILVFTARFFIEFIKENQVAFEATIPLNMGQWLSIPFILIGIGILLWPKKKTVTNQ